MLRSSLGHNNAVVRCWLSRGGGHLARLFMGPPSLVVSLLLQTCILFCNQTTSRSILLSIFVCRLIVLRMGIDNYLVFFLVFNVLSLASTLNGQSARHLL